MERFYSTRDFCEEILRSLPVTERTKLSFGNGKGILNCIDFLDKGNRIGYLSIENLQGSPQLSCLFFFVLEDQYVYRKMKVDKKSCEIFKSKKDNAIEDPLERVLYVMEKVLSDFKKLKPSQYTSDELNGLLFDGYNYPNGGILWKSDTKQ